MAADSKLMDAILEVLPASDLALAEVIERRLVDRGDLPPTGGGSQFAAVLARLVDSELLAFKRSSHGPAYYRTSKSPSARSAVALPSSPISPVAERLRSAIEGLH